MFKLLKKNKNYKFLLGLIIALVIVSPVTYAYFIGASSEVSFNNANTWLTSDNVQDALDELYLSQLCPPSVYMGGYVSYTPSSSSYTIGTDMTGYSSSQTINPSELNLWRIMGINQDGSVEIISNSVSSSYICFSGSVGYINLIGALNTLAGSYETSNITNGHRYFGYSDQTEYLTEILYTTSSTNQSTCSSASVGCPLESGGGGDYGFSSDYNIVGSSYNVTRFSISKLRAASVGGTYSNYWIASRSYSGKQTSYKLMGRYVYSDGSIIDTSNLVTSNNQCNYLRPIVILRSGLLYDGDGTSKNPWIVR